MLSEHRPCWSRPGSGGTAGWQHHHRSSLHLSGRRQTDLLCLFCRSGKDLMGLLNHGRTLERPSAGVNQPR